jgi:hypothetical protein
MLGHREGIPRNIEEIVFLERCDIGKKVKV